MGIEVKEQWRPELTCVCLLSRLSILSTDASPDASAANRYTLNSKVDQRVSPETFHDDILEARRRGVDIITAI